MVIWKNWLARSIRWFSSRSDRTSETPDEKEMIHGIRELSSTMVKEIMVPRIDVAFFSLDAPVQETLQKIVESGYSRFPIYKDTIDNVVGMLYVKDILMRLVQGQPIRFEEIIRKPFFVPESKKLDSLLREMKRRRVHIAIVVDEYGGVSGIVCLEDIIEEVIGEIQDEFDDEKEEIIRIGENSFLCDARINMHDLNEELNLDLPEEEFDTLGGFVFELFGKIPARYEKVSYKNLEFVIQEMEGHKIKSIKILLADTDEKPQNA
ncbi:MAG: HlyC/CorC family transporter [Spirochaetales bacterium]|nr:HlyC/CorC family transporter [Spirochaetales bacterium]